MKARIAGASIEEGAAGEVSQLVYTSFCHSSIPGAICDSNAASQRTARRQHPGWGLKELDPEPCIGYKRQGAAASVRLGPQCGRRKRCAAGAEIGRVSVCDG